MGPLLMQAAGTATGQSGIGGSDFQEKEGWRVGAVGGNRVLTLVPYRSIARLAKSGL